MNLQYHKHRSIFNRFRGTATGILTNQSAYGYKNKYHFEYYQNFVELKYIFIPEHGLFSELQDQVSGANLQYNFSKGIIGKNFLKINKDNVSTFESNTPRLQFINLYGDSEDSLFVDLQILNNINLLIIDIRDTGARYYTFLTSCYYLMQQISKHNNRNQKIEVLIVDSSNPAGRKVEGSPLQKKYESFVGVPTVLHRHGLTPAELLSYYNIEFKLNIEIHIIPIGEIYKKKDVYWIPPSPNIPFHSTCKVYAGQCLLEGTNISEGRGTTRPFEIFGAPYIEYDNEALFRQLTKYQKGQFVIRPLKFIPVFHKFKNEVCGGFQLIVKNEKKFHSLLFSLNFIRTVNEFYPEKFMYREGVYEFKSDQSAIEILAGDDMILDFLKGKISYSDLENYFAETERKWQEKTNN